MKLIFVYMERSSLMICLYEIIHRSSLISLVFFQWNDLFENIIVNKFSSQNFFVGNFPIQNNHCLWYLFQTRSSLNTFLYIWRFVYRKMSLLMTFPYEKTIFDDCFIFLIDHSWELLYEKISVDDLSIWTNCRWWLFYKQKSSLMSCLYYKIITDDFPIQKYDYHWCHWWFFYD